MHAYNSCGRVLTIKLCEKKGRGEKSKKEKKNQFTFDDPDDPA